MPEYFQFFIGHWFLSLSFIIVLILFIINEIWAQKTGAQKLSATQVVQKMNQNNAVIIDIRSKTEFKAGHILGAKNMLIDDVCNKLNVTDKERPIIVVCSKGENTSKLALQLKEKGYNSFYLKGGMSAWREEGLPLER